MKVQYASDLHLEMYQNRDYMIDNPIIPVADVLALAGDITKMQEKYYKDEIFDYFSKNWKLVIVVPGNHEYYNNRDIKAINRVKLNEKIRENVLLVNNNIITYEGINFICTILWSNLSPTNMYAVERGMNDFNVIKGYHNGSVKTMNGNWYNELHRECKRFLFDSLLKLKGQKNVVVTHHGPTQLINAPEYKGSSINAGFIVDMEDYIHDFDIDYWIFGHTHKNIDAELFGTKIVCNQIGYTFYNENATFKPEKFFEIKTIKNVR